MKKQKYKIGFIIAIVLIIILSVSGSGALIYGLNRYNQQQRRYDSLNSDYSSLKSQHTSLKSEHNSMQSQYNTKKTEYNNLQSDYNRLQGNYNSLQNDYNYLFDQYEGYSESIEVRYGDGDDCKLFVTPSDYSVISAARNALGHYSDNDLSWDDTRKINNWVHDHVEYNHDTFIGNRRNCYFYPSETLDFGYGDCEDQAVLMLSMCLAEEDVSWIYCAEVSYYRNGESRGHLFVIVNVENDKMYIFDPTSAQRTFLFGGDAWDSGSSKPEPDALREFEDYFGVSSLRVRAIFNEKVRFTFNSNQEFFDFL